MIGSLMKTHLVGATLALTLCGISHATPLEKLSSGPVVQKNQGIQVLGYEEAQDEEMVIRGSIEPSQKFKSSKTMADVQKQLARMNLPATKIFLTDQETKALRGLDAQEACQVVVGVTGKNQGFIAKTFSEVVGYHLKREQQTRLTVLEVLHEIGHCVRDIKNNTTAAFPSLSPSESLKLMEFLKGSQVGVLYDEAFADSYAGLKHLEEGLKQGKEDQAVRDVKLMEAWRLGLRDKESFERWKAERQSGVKVNPVDRLSSESFDHSTEESLHALTELNAKTKKEPDGATRETLEEKAAKLAGYGTLKAVFSTDNAKKVVNQTFDARQRVKELNHFYYDHMAKTMVLLLAKKQTHGVMGVPLNTDQKFQDYLDNFRSKDMKEKALYQYDKDMVELIWKDLIPTAAHAFETLKSPEGQKRLSAILDKKGYLDETALMDLRNEIRQQMMHEVQERQKDGLKKLELKSQEALALWNKSTRDWREQSVVKVKQETLLQESLLKKEIVELPFKVKTGVELKEWRRLRSLKGEETSPQMKDDLRKMMM